MKTPCYNINEIDLSCSSKRGGVCLYYLKSPAQQVFNESYLSKYLVCVVIIQKKKGCVSFYIDLQAKVAMNSNNFSQIL